MCPYLRSIQTTNGLISFAMPHVFAYGSNLWTPRLRERVENAQPISVGFVTKRRLAFHKRGADGSAKADAHFTDCADDRVWGVVFAMSDRDKRVLDDHEIGYATRQVIVVSEQGELAANIYAAQTEFIDMSLRPFDWYHRFVELGAVEHKLPAGYVAEVQAVECVADGDFDRGDRHWQLIATVEQRGP